MHPLIEQHRDEILTLARRRGIENVRVFGSMARDEADETSDADLLVSIPRDKSALELGGLLVEIQSLLHRRVDVVSDRGLHPAFWPRCGLMKPAPQSERVLLDRVRECIERIHEYTGGAQDTFVHTPMVRDAAYQLRSARRTMASITIRNLDNTVKARLRVRAADPPRARARTAVIRLSRQS